MVRLQYGSAVSSPARFQFEDNSGTLYASQTNNCGPTCATKIACFYRNTWYGIEATRRMVTACCVPTTGQQQAAMLSARGVPAEAVWIDTLSQLKQIVGSDGRRPVIIGIQMSRVPASVRDHPFTGWHAVTVLSTVTLMTGEKGFWIMDPNFSPYGGYRPDPDNGRKFYSESVLYYAYIMNNIRWSVCPKRRKSAPVPTILADGDHGMKYKDEYGHTVILRDGKPMRESANVTSKVLKRADGPKQMKLVGRIPKARMPNAEQQYGDVFIATRVFTGGHRLVYLKQVDCRDYE